MLHYDSLMTPDQPLSEECSPPGSKTMLLTLETSGLSPRNSFVIMGGAGCRLSDGWHQTILIAENRRDEAALLQRLHDMLSGAETLYLFGYHTFFKRFINERWENITGGASDFFDPKLTIIDLQYRLKKIRSLLPLTSLSRHEIENSLGYKRSAPQTGREIAQIYGEYQQKGSTGVPNELLLHLQEDLMSYFSISALESYPLFFDGQFEPDRQKPFEIIDDQLHIYASAVRAFPFPLSHTDEYREIKLEQSKITVTVPLYFGKLKFFYPGSPSDYFYLPEEDRAIHKSLGMFVDKKHRIRATRATCYTTREGLFLKCPVPSGFSSLFYTDYNKPPAYIAYEPEKWQTSPDDLKRYMQQIINC